MLNVCIPHVRAIDHKDDSVAATVIRVPKSAQRVLTSYIPELQVQIGQGYGRDILADSRYRLQVGMCLCVVQSFDLFEECRLTSIVQA